MITEEKFLVCGKPDIGQDEEDALVQVLRSGWLGNGPVSKRFEKEFAAEFRVPDAVAVGSCTVGLMLALKSAGVERGDGVITTPLTFAATVNAILALGANPIFSDVDKNGVLDPSKLVFWGMEKVILPVHLWGQQCDMKTICAIAEEENCLVIEDCAHGFGPGFGTSGDFGVFSFYPTKNIASCDGGMVIGKSKKALEKIRIMASQGLSTGAWGRYSNTPIKDYEVSMVGFKGLMNDISAAIALAQFHRRAELKKKRDRIFRIYEDAFGVKQMGHSHHIYEIRVKNRTKVRRELHKRGIGTGVHYSPLHLEPAYKFLGYKKGQFPIAEEIGRETLTFPLSPAMTEDDAYRVVEAVNEIKGDGK